MQSTWRPCSADFGRRSAPVTADRRGAPIRRCIRLLRESETQPTPGLAELKIVRRQTRSDGVLLSRWFSGEAPEPGADEVWDRLSAESANGVRAIGWNNDADLQVKLLGELTVHIRATGDSSFGRTRRRLRSASVDPSSKAALTSISQGTVPAAEPRWKIGRSSRRFAAAKRALTA